MKNILFRCVAAITLAASSLAASGNSLYPDRPITLVVAYPAGGSTDLVARKWGGELSKRLKQPVIVENVGGAGGLIGARRVAKSPADGYTLLLGAVNEVVLSPLTNKNSPYKTSDFRAVGILGASPVVLLSNKSKGYRSIADVAAAAKKKAQVSYGTPGRGTFQHIVMHSLESRLKIDLLHIPYKGGASFIQDAISGQIDLILLPTVTAIPMLAGDQLQGVATSAAARVEGAQALPTFGDSMPELKGFDFTIWAGLFAPVGTPTPIVDRLNDALREIHQSDSIQSFIRGSGMAVPAGGLDLWGAQRFLDAEERKYRSIVPAMKLDD
jgi:tripartite-type tricarboxylate transporter receptor subunit TctC